MRHQPMFVHTSKGYINLALVRLIVEENEQVKFVFDDVRGQFITLPKKEGEVVLMTMAQEMLVYE